MPFKLGGMRKKKYTVSSKNLFVISIELLDSQHIDCTLSSDSFLGSECLENVCQRICINQPEFFGLRYTAKGSSKELRWVDLERPLNRQLEKYAANSKVLYLRVMYFVISGITLINDEVTRNYYFLQLKQDVVEGRISCDPKQAVILSNYSRQAEYGNYQDRHTVEYLKTLLSFPKHLIDAGLLETLTEEVIQRHDEVHNVTQSAAEELYIAACQQLDGYGQETFSARNDDSVEVMLGISVSGIIVATTSGYKFYKWRDITNVVNHKRTFNIECTDPSYNVGFTLSDAELGRYVWRLSVLQHTFFMNFEQNPTNASSQVNLFRNLPDNFNDSREDLLCESRTNLSSTNANSQTWITSSESFSNLQSRTSLQTASVLDVNNMINSTSCLDLSNSNLNLERERLKSLLPTYRPPPPYYESLVQQKYQGSHPDINHSATNIALHNNTNTAPDVTHTTGKITHILAPHYSDSSDYALAQRYKMMRVAPPPYPANRLSSTSTPDLALASHRGLVGLVGFRAAQVSGSSPDLVSQRTINPLFLQHMQASHGHPVFYNNNVNVGKRHSHSFLPHATYENLNFIETANSNLRPKQHVSNNNLIYRTSTSTVATVAQHMDMELFLQNQKLHQQKLHKQTLQNHHNQSLTLSNTQISEPIYENVPLPSYSAHSSNQNISVSTLESSVSTGFLINVPMHKKNTTKPIPLERKESCAIATTSFKQNGNNGKSVSVAARDVTFGISGSASTSNLLESSLNSKHSTSNIHNSTANLNFSGSSLANITTTTTTTDSGVSSVGRKEKKNKIWAILSGGRSRNSTQKSATLGREKDKDKKSSQLTKELESNMKHRWSTGLPKLQPLPSNVSKESLCLMLELKLMDSQLFLEFERIPKRKENAKYECALHEENRNKNIDYNHGLPTDENRVRLTPSMSNKIGYVNASHITSTVGQKQRFYIVAQSPWDSTTANVFWQCVWEADVYLLVQLSNELTYVPNNSERSLDFGQYQVWREFSQETNRCVTSKLRIYHTQSRRYRSVWHLSYSEWNDQNCPQDVSHFLKFMEEMNSVRLASQGEVPPGHNINTPVLIHCEGNGRSGVALVADLVFYTLDHNQDLDIPRVVGQLQQQRELIPSLAQYKFIYSLLIHYLKQTRLI